MIALHAYHNKLLGLVRSLEERRKEIRDTKPPEEQPTRLRLLQAVPDDMLPVEVRVAGERFLGAKEAHDAAYLAWDRELKSNPALQGKTTHEVWVARVVAGQVLGAAYLHWCDILGAHAAEIEALHKRLCTPDCPWDGKTIFPTK